MVVKGVRALGLLRLSRSLQEERERELTRALLKTEQKGRKQGQPVKKQNRRVHALQRSLVLILTYH